MMSLVEEIIKLRRSFKMAKMNPPESINLATPEDGDQFLINARETLTHSYFPFWEREPKMVEMDDGSVFMEVKVADIKVRWPTRRMMMVNGSWRVY